MIDLQELNDLSTEELTARARANPLWWEEVTKVFTQVAEQDQKECQITYYRPSNPMALPAHRSRARELVLNGGNRSTKTTTALVELVAIATGHVPIALKDVLPREKIRGPIRARIMCNSLTDTWEPVIKPKLKFDAWNGPGDPGQRGHWGLVPRHCLAGGTWENAWSEKHRTLKVAFCVLCKTVWGDYWPDTWAGMSTIQVLSYEQDLSALAGSSMHLILHDELPPQDMYRENRMRTLDVKGTIITAFTPPDEGGQRRADVSWFYDEIFEPGLPGPHKHPDIETFQLFTEKNDALPADEVAKMAERMTDDQRRSRLYGEFVHLSGLVHPLFTSHGATWCFGCRKRILTVEGQCPACGSADLTDFVHVIEPFEIPLGWPRLFVIDPHFRKPDAMGWFAITPSDDLILTHELEKDGDIPDVVREIRSVEEANRITPAKRLMDPNIGTERNDRLERGWTLREAFGREGIRCDLAIDDVTVGIQNVNDYLRPDPHTRKPRFQVFRSCEKFIYGMQRFTFDEWVRAGDRDPKEKVRDKFKDFPDLVRYAVNDRPTYHGYKVGLAFQHRRAKRGR